MTKAQAKAILQCQRAINRALDTCVSRLDAKDRDHAEAYWIGHIRSSINGFAYGSAPIARCEETLNETP